jgi:hypothetical protein
MLTAKRRPRWMRPGNRKIGRSRMTCADFSTSIPTRTPRPKSLPRVMRGIWQQPAKKLHRQCPSLHPTIEGEGDKGNAIRIHLPRPPIPAQCLILCYLADALGLLVTHLYRRDLVAIFDAAHHLLASGLDFL